MNFTKERQSDAIDALGEINKLEEKIINYENTIMYPEESNVPIKYAWITFETME